MKRTIRFAQTVFIPHTSSVIIEVEEEQIPEILTSVGIEDITEMKLDTIKAGGVDFEANDDMSVYTIANQLNQENEVECEPDMWREWMGTYSLWVEDMTPAEENNVAN